MLLVLSTLYGAYGGIPAFNRLLVQAAAGFCRRQRLPLVLLALTDPPLPATSAAAALPTHRPDARPDDLSDDLRPRLPPGVVYRPCHGDRRALLRAFLSELGRPLPLILGHVHLAPLGLVWPGPYGVIAHGSEVYAPLAPLRRLGLRRAQRVACVSDHTLGCVVDRQGVAAPRCLRVVNALPQLPRRTDPPPRPSAAPLRLLCISRLHPAEPKGIDALLRALARLPPGFAELTILGEGAARPALQALAQDLGLGLGLGLGPSGDRVRFLGAVSDAVRDAELDACDAFALPSEGEGFGIVYLEALARGKPCIAAAAGGAPEIVRDGETGFLIPAPVAAHIPQLAAAILALGDPALRAQLGQAGRQHVAARHSPDAFAARAEAFFAALSGPPPLDGLRR